MTSVWGTRNQLAELVALAQHHELHSEIEVIGLSQVQEAHARLESGNVTGRFVIDPTLGT
jgi:D-arabinose 1-dehydrogenase-like Zn-dependent alcohol dehydrogenase